MSYNATVSYTSLASAINDGYELLRRFRKHEFEIYENAIAMYGCDDFCVVDCENESNYGYRFALVKRNGIAKEKTERFYYCYRVSTRKHISQLSSEVRKELPSVTAMARKSLKALRDATPFPDAILAQRFREGQYYSFARAIELCGKNNFAIVDCLHMRYNFGYRFALMRRRNTSEREITEFYKTAQELKKI
jgi:hypothetical protein